MSGAPGVPFRMRLQMYPRVGQLLAIPLILVGWMILSLGDGGTGEIVWIALVSGLAMWVMVPDICRYRAFGLPLRYWTRDADGAVFVVAVLFCVVGVAVSAGWWSCIGILVAVLAVGVAQRASVRRTVRGDRRVPETSRQAGGSWTTLVGRMPAAPGPLPWRLVYLPVATASLASGALFSGGFGVVRAAAGMADDGPVDLVSLLPLMAVFFSAVAGVLAGGLRGWTVMGIPVRRWLGHAYTASAVAVLVLFALVGLAMSTGVVGMAGTSAQMSLGQVLLILGLTVLCIAVIPLTASSGTFLMLLVGLIPAGGLILAIETTDPLRGPVPVVGAVVVTVMSAAVVIRTRRELLGGDRARPTGFIQAAERTYYERQGAL
jgi:hypothetical protein